MAVPLIPIMLGSMAVSGGANLYSQYRQRQIYALEAKHQKAMYDGYVSFLKRKGLSPNPHRAWNSYYGAYYKARNNQDISTVGSVGTAFGTLGAASAFSRGLYRSTGRTSRWL